MAKDEKREQRTREATVPPPGVYRINPKWIKDVLADGKLVLVVPAPKL